MPMIPHRRQNHRPNGYVLLDSAWAQRLGVQRTGGLYRISRRDLAHRLARLSATLPLADRTHGGIRGLTINEPQHGIAGLAHDSHVVGFYETDAHLADTVRDFLTPGLHAGAAAIVVATAYHRDLFGRVLTEAGIDLSEAQ